MRKKKLIKELGMNIEDLDEEDLKKLNLKKIDEEEDEVDVEDVGDVGDEEFKKPRVKPKKELTQRFVAFNVPPRLGIMDSETNEVAAEGDFAILQALAKIISQNERIESNLGSMMEE